MSSDLTVEVDQEYERYDLRESTVTRIRVVGEPEDDWRGTPSVRIATVAPFGYLIRHRQIAMRQLHNNPNRKTGYRLVQHADGTPAAGGVR